MCIFFCRKKQEQAIAEAPPPEKHFNEEVKERAGSVPPLKYVKDFSKHDYMEIPEPGSLEKDKAFSTGEWN